MSVVAAERLSVEAATLFIKDLEKPKFFFFFIKKVTFFINFYLIKKEKTKLKKLNFIKIRLLNNHYFELYLCVVMKEQNIKKLKRNKKRISSQFYNIKINKKTKLFGFSN